MTWYPQSLSFITIVTTPPPPVSVSLDSMICTTNTSAFPLLKNNITRPRPSRHELNIHSPKSVSSEAPDFLRHLANQTWPLNREVKPSITCTSRNPFHCGARHSLRIIGVLSLTYTVPGPRDLLTFRPMQPLTSDFAAIECAKNSSRSNNVACSPPAPL